MNLICDCLYTLFKFILFIRMLNSVLLFLNLLRTSGIALLDEFHTEILSFNALFIGLIFSVNLTFEVCVSLEYFHFPVKGRKMELQLSSTVVDGLKSLGTDINIDLTKKLIANAVKLALYADDNIPPNPEIYASKPDYAKQSEYAVTTLMFLATKHNYDNQKLRNLLEQHGVLIAVADDLIKAYESNRQEIYMKCLRTGFSLPHITDVEWNLSCDVKTSTSDCPSSDFKYKINMGKINDRTGLRETCVEFVCNVEELQSLVHKLKEIEMQCEKIANN